MSARQESWKLRVSMSYASNFIWLTHLLKLCHWIKTKSWNVREWSSKSPAFIWRLAYAYFLKVKFLQCQSIVEDEIPEICGCSGTHVYLMIANQRHWQRHRKRSFSVTNYIFIETEKNKSRQCRVSFNISTINCILTYARPRYPSHEILHKALHYESTTNSSTSTSACDSQSNSPSELSSNLVVLHGCTTTQSDRKRSYNKLIRHLTTFTRFEIRCIRVSEGIA